MKHTYIITELNGYEIRVAYENEVVRIKNDSELKEMLDNTNHGAWKLAGLLKSTYAHYRLEQLDIEKGSLAVEILAHVYLGEFFDCLEDLPLPKSVTRKFRKLSKRTDIIDCGTADGADDNNRVIWDIIYKVMENTPIILPIGVDPLHL